jgi:hypothetical protein
MRQLSAPLDSICPPGRACAPEQPVAGVAMDTLLAHVRTVIAEHGCTLLLIERSVRVGGTAIRIDAVYADGSRRKGIARSGDAAMRAVCQAANATLRQLAASMPEGLDDQVGLMTDGTGALFSPERPSSTGGDWLGAMLGGAVQSVEISPFALNSRWSRLSAPQHGGKAH